MAEPAPATYSYQELNELDHLDVDALRALAALELAGERFYAALADRVGDEEVAALLRRNGREEAGHARRLDRAIAHKLGAPAAPTTPDADPAPVRLPDVVGAELLAKLVQGELDGDAGYQRWADHEPDPEVARLLRLNGREETIHGRRVTEAIALLASRG